jgi:hypothetical protein
MTKLEKAELLDRILLKFQGNKTIAWDYFHKPEFYKDLHDNYYVVENHLNYLIGDEMLTKERQIDNEKSDKARMNIYSEYSFLTPKGFAVMTDLENLGYVRTENERIRIDKREDRTLTYAKLAFWSGLIATIITLLGFVKCNSDNSNKTVNTYIILPIKTKISNTQEIKGKSIKIDSLKKSKK